MLKFTTASGATYLIDRENYRAMRVEGPYSPGIDYHERPDAVWHDLTIQPQIVVGERTYLHMRGSMYRLTTAVVEIEEV